MTGDETDEPVALVGTPAPVVEEEGVLRSMCGLCGRRFEGTDPEAVTKLLAVHQCLPSSADPRPGEAGQGRAG